MINKKWKDIAGYEGLYQISNLGEVKSLKRTYQCGNCGNITKELREKLMKQSTSKFGYKRVKLCKNGNENIWLIHRLVAIAFLDNKTLLPQVNHKDENKSNNMVDNLEWCDAKYNINYGTGLSRMVEKQSKKVLQYDTAGKFMKVHTSIRGLKKLGFDRSSIIRCCQNKQITAYGYVWKYYSEVMI